MTARAIGSATISFGLVSVPVKLYSAADTTASISFNLIHKGCGSRLKTQYVCRKEGVVVERDDMVKGFEFAKDQYVLFSPEELKALEAESDNAIDIAEFVPAEQVDPIYFEKSYYLGPDKGGARAYHLLSEALAQTGLSALGRYAARGKQYLVLLRPRDGGLLMEQLHYADEVRAFSEVPVGKADVKDAELKLAVQLVQSSASDAFDPAPYKDEVRERVLELIERKVEGEDITEAPAAEAQPQIIDLMAALKASLEKGGADEGRKSPRRAGRKGTEKGKAGKSGRKSGGRRRKAGGE